MTGRSPAPSICSPSGTGLAPPADREWRAQDFSLELGRRDEVKKVIGERAEFLAYANCVMVQPLRALKP